MSDPSGSLAFNAAAVQRLRRLAADRKARAAERRFVIDGPVLLAEAARAGVSIEEQFVPEHRADAAVRGAGTVRPLRPGVFERVASTDHPRPPIAIAEQPDHDVGGVLASAQLVIALDAIADPGNLGTIARSAEAAGVDAVVVTPGSVDPYNPKVVRASAGSLFHVPVVTATLDDVRVAGLTVWGTSSHDAGVDAVRYDEAEVGGRAAVLFGSEAHGLDPASNVDGWLTIPHAGRSESLNVAMAATVIAFELTKRRRDAGAPPTQHHER